eukprot:scaffold9290_cov63-Phaeocystis_antarctica.AAC.3
MRNANHTIHTSLARLKIGSAPAIGGKEAEHSGCYVCGRGLSIARLEVSVKVQDEEAQRLGHGEEGRQQLNHGLVHTGPKKGDVIGELSGASR